MKVLNTNVDASLHYAGKYTILGVYTKRASSETGLGKHCLATKGIHSVCICSVRSMIGSRHPKSTAGKGIEKQNKGERTNERRVQISSR
jgi:hypothetical protein